MFGPKRVGGVRCRIPRAAAPVVPARSARPAAAVGRPAAARPAGRPAPTAPVIDEPGAYDGDENSPFNE